MGDNLTMLLITAFIINGSQALIAILLHYEALFQLDKLLPKIAHIAPRFRVLVGVGAIFMAHVVEIWLFALGYFFTLQFPVMGVSLVSFRAMAFCWIAPISHLLPSQL